MRGKKGHLPLQMQASFLETTPQVQQISGKTAKSLGKGGYRFPVEVFLLFFFYILI